MIDFIQLRIGCLKHLATSPSRQTLKEIKKNTFFNFFFSSKMAQFLPPELVRQVIKLECPYLFPLGQVTLHGFQGFDDLCLRCCRIFYGFQAALQ